MEGSELYAHLSGVFDSRPEQAAEDLKNDKVQGDKLWPKYLKEVEGYDKRVTDNWKADADGILFFAGLLSATVGIFIIESYKMLNPASGDQTVFLLGQISQQMAGFTNGNNTSIQPQPLPPFSPSVSVIYINAVWLLSLVLSTASAVLATLTRPWARRYTELPQIPSSTRECARVRSFLFLGTQRYTMGLTVEAALILLHLSVFLFYAGLVLFFFMIFKTVAMVVLVPVGIFGIVYVTLTLLPLLDHLCPYFTPMTGTLWYLWHTLRYLPWIVYQWVIWPLRTFLVDRQHRWLIRMLVGKPPRVGFQRRIIDDALSRAHHIDVAALTWLFQLPALAEKSKCEGFIAAIPKQMIVDLFNVHFWHTTKSVFRNHLFDLLQSCAPDIVELDDYKRNRRLSICMDALHHIVRSATFPHRLGLPTAYSLTDVRTRLAKLNSLMQALRDDENFAIRVAACSICTLLTSNLLQGYDRNTLWYLYGDSESDSQWLRDVMAWPDDAINTISRDNPTAPPLDNMGDTNVDAFVCGVLSRQTVGLSIVQATSFTETLATLMGIPIHSDGSRQTFEDRLPSLIERVARGNCENPDNVVNRLREMFGGFLRSEAHEASSDQDPVGH